ncbi:MAG: DUF2971 domain-containing protein [Desulfobacterales bacterium]
MNCKITRYMPLDKFLAFLTNGLFVPSVKILGDDKWEGLLILRKVKKESRANYMAMFRTVSQWVYVSCWHKEDQESYGMWKIYGRDANAIAIQTTTDKLKEAYRKSQQNTLAYLDDVVYLNPSNPDLLQIPFGRNVISRFADRMTNLFPIILAFFVKHNAYEFEKEVRLVALDKDYNENESKGNKNSKKNILIDWKKVPDFIESIRLSPSAETWFRNIVKDILEKYDIAAPIVESDLEAPDVVFSES